MYPYFKNDTHVTEVKARPEEMLEIYKNYYKDENADNGLNRKAAEEGFEASAAPARPKTAWPSNVTPGEDFDLRGKKPQGRPPQFVPPKDERIGVLAADPGSMRRCVENYVYIWPDDGQPFWMYAVNVGGSSISGYRWSRFGWVYSGIELANIESFCCLPA
jgi:hypothetical protein